MSLSRLEGLVTCRLSLALKGPQPVVSLSPRRARNLLTQLGSLPLPHRCRSNTAHIRQPRPDSGLCFQGGILARQGQILASAFRGKSLNVSMCSLFARKRWSKWEEFVPGLPLMIRQWHPHNLNPGPPTPDPKPPNFNPQTQNLKAKHQQGVSEGGGGRVPLLLLPPIGPSASKRLISHSVK